MLSNFTGDSMDPSEIEFLAESEPLRIVPNFNEGQLYLLGGDVGPFRAGLPVTVPLWVAVSLRQRQKCRIIQPDWMDADRSGCCLGHVAND
jgi:GINS complex subunit 2